MSQPSSRPLIAAMALFLFIVPGRDAVAQVTPAAGYTPPDDTPSVKVGATIFADYTFQSSPDVTDAAGNAVNLNSFNVARAYLNVTGQVHHLLSFRVTPDVQRETGAGATLSGSNVFRLKYAFGQFNLDDWMTHGSWVRLGLQQTPYIDYEESIYVYRFQGTLFPEREGFFSSSDYGMSFHTNLKDNYGDVHVGIYNGENYGKFEVNDRKSFQVRGTLRPLPAARLLRGLRVTGFYNADTPLKQGTRRRAIGEVTFEHPIVRAGFTYLNTSDRPLPAAPEVQARGFSTWVTPRASSGWAGLLRYDHFEPDTSTDQKKDRSVVGVAYWLPLHGAQSASLLLDLDTTTYHRFTAPRPKEQRVAVHMLINF